MMEGRNGCLDKKAEKEKLKLMHLKEIMEKIRLHSKK
jgi:hypothetical protein